MLVSNTLSPLMQYDMQSLSKKPNLFSDYPVTQFYSEEIREQLKDSDYLYIKGYLAFAYRRVKVFAESNWHDSIDAQIQELTKLMETLHIATKATYQLSVIHNIEHDRSLQLLDYIISNLDDIMSITSGNGILESILKRFNWQDREGKPQNGFRQYLWYSWYSILKSSLKILSGDLLKFWSERGSQLDKYNIMHEWMQQDAIDNEKETDSVVNNLLLLQDGV